MKIAECLLPICILGMCAAEVYVGFEAEVRKLTISDRVPMEKPVISGESWGLSTDLKRKHGYVPEFFTIGGLQINAAIQAAKEIETTLSALLDKVNSVSEELSSFSTFKELGKEKQKNISQMNECFKTDIKGEVGILQDIKILEEIYKCLCHLYMKKTGINIPDGSIQQYIDKLTERTLMYYGETLTFYLNHYPRVFELFDNPELANSYKNSNDSREVAKTLFINQVKKNVLLDQIKKTKKQYLDLCKDSEYLFDNTQIETLRTSIEERYHDVKDNKDKQKLKTGLLDTAENFHNISAAFYNFDSLDTDIKPNHGFKAFCGYDVEKNFNLAQSDKLIDENFVCPANKINIGFQLTYETKLASLPNLLKFYSSYSSVLDEPGAEERLNKHYMPVELVKVGDCLINGKSCLDFMYMKKNHQFARIWEAKRKSLQEMLDNYYKIHSSRDAEGLFYLVLSYALRIFNRNVISYHADRQRDDLIYGPKKDLPIMSRVAFSELFDNLPEADKKFFIELMSNLCDFDSRTDKSSVEDMHDQLNCSKLILVKYSTTGSSFNDIDRYSNSKPINFIEWVKSIINSDERLPEQPKIDVKKKERVSSPETDNISPPPGFAYLPKQTDELIENLQEHKIYSMGAYTGIQPGNVLIELRPYSSLPITANNIGAFIEGHAALLFDLLSEERQITDFGAYREHANKMQAEHMKQTGIEGGPITGFMQQKRLLI